MALFKRAFGLGNEPDGNVEDDNASTYRTAKSFAAGTQTSAGATDSSGQQSQLGATWPQAFTATMNSGFAWGAPRSAKYEGSMLRALGVLKEEPVESVKAHLDVTEDICSVMTMLKIVAGDAIDVPERSKAHIFEAPIASEHAPAGGSVMMEREESAASEASCISSEDVVGVKSDETELSEADTNKPLSVLEDTIDNHQPKLALEKLVLDEKTLVNYMDAFSNAKRGLFEARGKAWRKVETWRQRVAYSTPTKVAVADGWWREQQTVKSQLKLARRAYIFANIKLWKPCGPWLWSPMGMLMTAYAFNVACVRFQIYVAP